MRVEFSSLRTDRIRRVQDRIAAQPSWAVRTAAMTFALIVLLPIILLVAVAFLVAVLVFGILGLVNRAAAALGGVGVFARQREGGQGRRNVTVLPRES